MIGILAQNGSTSSGGSIAGLLVPLVLMGGLFYFLLIRPQKRRSTMQNRLLESLEVGDEIMTAGGIFGTVKDMDEDSVTVEIAPGTDVRMVKRAIAQKLVEDEYEDEEPEEEADHTS